MSEFFAAFSASAIGAMLVYEVLLKPAGTKAVRTYGPGFVSKAMITVDRLVVDFIKEGKTGEQLEMEICAWAQKVTGETWGKSQVDALFADGYDARVLLDHASSK